MEKYKKKSSKTTKKMNLSSGSENLPIANGEVLKDPTYVIHEEKSQTEQRVVGEGLPSKGRGCSFTR